MTTADISILIADDNDINRWLLTEQLQYLSSNITQASHGGEAWQLLQSQAYALVLLDVNMPVLSGIEVIHKLKASDSCNRSTPAIAVTAHIQSRQLLLESGFDDCLIKPVVLADLQRITTQWCSNSEGRSPEYYARAVLEKIEYNRVLGRCLLEKLFAELPDQLANIDRALQNQQSRSAWELVHRLHGSVCFCGFADLQPLTARLEQALLDGDVDKAIQQFVELSQQLIGLLANRDAVLASLEGSVGL